MKTIVAALLAMMAVGCSTNPHTKSLQVQALGANVQYMKAMAEKQQQLLLDATIPVCSDGHCEYLTIQVANPTQNTIAPLQLPRDEWAGVARDALKTGGTIAGILAGGWATHGIIDGVGKVVTSTLANQKAPTVVYQPAPQVFNQPEPTIVNPTIVNQPQPVVVKPEVVNPVVVNPEVVETEILR